jgi:CRP/FNR family cyclic AMP-dependent transcriptional regulator
VQRPDESPAWQEEQSLGKLGDDLGDGARDIGVNLVVLLGAAAWIQGDLRNEELAREALAVDVVGESSLVLDHEAVQLGPPPEHGSHAGLHAFGAQARLHIVFFFWTSLVHVVTVSPIPRLRQDVCPRSLAGSKLKCEKPTMNIPSYEPAAALEFFKAGGQVESIPAGRTIFRENRLSRRLLLQRDKMYLLLKGRVSLIAGTQELRSVKAGEIFGELAALASVPRSATAVAKTACRVIALDQRQFKKALAKKPSFALMLMKLMVTHLRELVARLKASDAFSGDDALEESAVFNPRLLADAVRGLSDDPPVSFMRNQVILEEGQLGTRAYVVLQGRVAVTIGGSVVDHIGPGGVLGELALLDQAPRLASAVAEDNVSLQPISRNAFIALVKLDPELGAGLLAALAERLLYLTGRLK